MDVDIGMTDKDSNGYNFNFQTAQINYNRHIKKKILHFHTMF